MEERVAVFDDVEFRVHDEGEGSAVIAAISPPWERLSLPLWRDHRTGKPVRERFVRGSFAQALDGGADVKVYLEHDRGQLLGRTTSGTLRIQEDAEGLAYEFDVPDTQPGRDLLTLVRRRDIHGSSFGFSVGESGQEWDETDEAIIRTVVEVERLDHQAPTVDPAYPASQLSERSVQELQQELEAWRADAPLDEWMQAWREGMAKVAEAGL